VRGFRGVTNYLDTTGLKLRTVMPTLDFDALDSGFVTARITVGCSEINSRLRKRYAVPFALPAPEVICGWLTAIVTPDLYFRRGWDPASEQGLAILAEAARAREEMKEAADSNEGLFDLPTREDLTASAITQGTPMVYSEASPYSWTDVQSETLRGGGT
jgi:hypothetical protein